MPPTFLLEKIRKTYRILCPKCSRYHKKNGQLLKKPKLVYHQHGSMSGHRSAHCLNPDNFPDGYNVVNPDDHLECEIDYYPR